MRTKPGAKFGYQPTNTLKAPDPRDEQIDPSQPRSSPTELHSTLPLRLEPRRLSKVTNQGLVSRSTKAVLPQLPVQPPSGYPTHPPPPAQTMARARSESFSDDDLMIVSSQAMSSQGSQDYGSRDYSLGGDLMSTPSQPTPRRPHEVIDITDSPVAPALSPSKNANAANRQAQPTTSRPMFGRTTQMTVPGSPAPPPMSSSAAAAMAQQRKQQTNQNSMFNTNRNRPEHHRPQRLTGPLAPKPTDRKAAPRPMFSSQSSSQADGGSAYPISSFYNNSRPNQTIMNNKPISSAATHGDVDFYIDPDKAAADLKALLEGGMEDDDDEEEEEAAPAPAAGAPAAAPGLEKPAAKTSKAKKAGDDFVGEDGTVESINVRLLPHQVEGVRWMRGRELGPVKRGRVPKGGILADDMGLGKTLQSLSLIVTNPKPSKDSPVWKKHYERIDGATLVVAPLALIRQWEAEIKEKVSVEKPLRVCVHHGPQRAVRPKDLAQYDVVITTYQILVSEHGHSNDSLKSGCFGLNWYRVILDEAHSIKNRNAKMTKACYALSSEFRWCLTGTPMQNNLDELQSLVKFLRITPYDNLTEWRAHIDAPLKNGRGYLAIRRLHSLLRCFMKRRTKDVLKEEGALVPGGKKAMEAAAAAAKEEAASGITSSASKGPAAPSFKITERNVVSVSTKFTPAERKFYDRLEDRADKSLEKMMKGKAVSYANALVLLLRLRQACNHPNLLNLKLDKDKDALTTDAPPQKSATDGDIDDLADVFGGLGIQAKKCEVCMSDLTKDEQRACEDSGGDMVCASCVEDRDLLMSPAKKVKKEKSKKSKKGKKSKSKSKSKPSSRKTVAEDDDEDSDIPTRRRPTQRKPRNRRAIIDSDDEDEEAEGSWLVGEGDRGSLRLGKAGGSEDEDAEGGGDWVNSDDSIHHSENDSDDRSRLSSFIVDDEKPEKNKKNKKSKKAEQGQRRPNVFGDSESDSAGSATESDDSGSGSEEDSEEDSEESESDSDGDADDSRISEAEFFANIDGGSFLGGGQPRKTRRERLSAAHSRNVLVSAKIRKMMSILKEEAAEHKFIVFSQFTSMLDLVSPFLLHAGLGHVRYDGGMRNDAREASLHSLRNDPSTRVLLCSLKCGSLGLNLTAATRVVILEPFWNPFVEEQAIDRVHRLTQTVDVTVYKLTVADTVEQRILELQEKKRLLAAQALEGGLAKGGKGKKDGLKLGLKELMDLFKHDSRGGGDDDDHGPDAGYGGSGSGGSKRSGDSRGGADPNGIDEQLARFDKGVLRRPGSRPGSSQASSRQPTPTDSAYSRRW